MLDFRAHAGLQMLQFFDHVAQFVFGQYLAFGPTHGDVPSHSFANIFIALLHAPIAGVAECNSCGTCSVRVSMFRRYLEQALQPRAAEEKAACIVA